MLCRLLIRAIGATEVTVRHAAIFKSRNNPFLSWSHESAILRGVVHSPQNGRN